MDYNPCPLRTDSISLPPELTEILEVIAHNTHEVWAKGRIDDGWRYAPVYDAIQKTHPSLVPYSELPEAEKEYDRRTASQVMKVLIKMGFDIVPPTAPELLEGSHGI